MKLNLIGELWGKLKAGVDHYDFFVNLLAPILLLIVGFVHLFYGFLPGVPLSWISIIGVDAYLFVLMLRTALKMPKRIPERQVAIVTVSALFLVLVLSFAGLYIANAHVARAKTDCTLEKLTEPWDAAYFSLVTITTLGYGDYTPQTTDARKLVMGELLSGGLLLFFAFPVLGSRLAQFDEPTGTTIKRLHDGSWEVQANSAAPQKYAKGKKLTVTVGEQGFIEAKSSD
jgi:Ion channel